MGVPACAGMTLLDFKDCVDIGAKKKADFTLRFTSDPFVKPAHGKLPGPIRLL